MYCHVHIRKHDLFIMAYNTASINSLWINKNVQRIYLENDLSTHLRYKRKYLNNFQWKLAFSYWYLYKRYIKRMFPSINKSKIMIYQNISGRNMINYSYQISTTQTTPHMFSKIYSVKSINVSLMMQKYNGKASSPSLLRQVWQKSTQNTNYLYLSVSADAVFINVKSSPYIIANQIKKLDLNITYLVCKINR